MSVATRRSEIEAEQAQIVERQQELNEMERRLQQERAQLTIYAAELRGELKGLAIAEGADHDD